MGLNVAVAEFQEPTLEWDRNDISLRVSALNRASEIMLRKLAVWKDIFNIHKTYFPLS